MTDFDFYCFEKKNKFINQGVEDGDVTSVIFRRAS